MSQHLLFEINSNYFTFPVQDVNSIITKQSQDIRHVPDMPKFIEGLTQLREKTIEIIDLSKLFFNKENKDQEKIIVIINYKNDQFGIVIDKVHNIKNIEDKEIRQTVFVNEYNKYLSGIYTENENMWLVINIDALIDIKKIGDMQYDN